MSLVEVREQFVKRSGRYDLVTSTSTWADNGADFFINAGQDLLDEMFTLKKSYARVIVNATAGEYYATFERCRAIKDIWASTDEARWQLEKMSLADFRVAYPKPVTDIDSGAPSYYTPAYLRTQPEETNYIIEVFGTSEEAGIGKNYNYNGILWMPPCEEATTLEILGLFYQPLLTDDDDENWWTENKSFTLVLGACMALEMMNRNTTGVNDYELAIRRSLFGMELDMIEEDIADVSQMEG